MKIMNYVITYSVRACVRARVYQIKLCENIDREYARLNYYSIERVNRYRTDKQIASYSINCTLIKYIPQFHAEKYAECF